MTKEEFKRHIKKTLLELKLYAETYSGNELPNDFEFKWLFNEKIVAIGEQEVINLISKEVYISEDKIYPCVDLIVKAITKHNRILINGIIAGFEPRKFGKGWSNRLGPFVFGIEDKMIDKKVNPDSEDFKNNLFKKGLIHYK